MSAIGDRIRARMALLRARLHRNRLQILMTMLGLMLLAVVLWHRMLITVPAGSVGVLWLRFFGGTQIGFHYDPGTKLIAPWDKIFIYDARLRRIDDKVHALTRDGLSVEVETTISFAIDRNLVPVLHEKLGPQYETTIIQPVISSEIRNVVAELRPDDLYSLNRVSLAEDVARRIRHALSTNLLDVVNGRQLIVLQEFFIRNIALPPLVQVAIEQKIAEQQSALKYQYTLERERLESERKAIEAQGIRRFQEIVSSQISEPYLRWKGIDATLQLAKSSNAKVIVIGGQNGLPLILDAAGRSGQAANEDKGQAEHQTPPAMPATAAPSGADKQPDPEK